MISSPVIIYPLPHFGNQIKVKIIFCGRRICTFCRKFRSGTETGNLKSSGRWTTGNKDSLRYVYEGYGTFPPVTVIGVSCRDNQCTDSPRRKWSFINKTDPEHDRAGRYLSNVRLICTSRGDGEAYLMWDWGSVGTDFGESIGINESDTVQRSGR